MSAVNQHQLQASVLCVSNVLSNKCTQVKIASKKSYYFLEAQDEMVINIIIHCLYM